MTTIHEPLSPVDYANLPEVLKKEYEPITRLSGAGCSMHFPKRHVVKGRKQGGSGPVMYYTTDTANSLTVFKPYAFHFTSQAQAELVCRALNADPQNNHGYEFTVEPSLVFSCPECCTVTGNPHKPGCSNDKSS